MTGDHAASWARVVLVSGDSPGREWRVDQTHAGARVEIGSAPDCAWSVRAPGVMPRHAELYWDGEVIWVAAVPGASGIRVDGLVVDEWYATAHGSTIDVGGARLAVENGGQADPSHLPSRSSAATAPPSPPRASNPRTAPSAAPTDDNPFHAAATAILPSRSGPPGAADRDTDEVNAATRIAMFEAQQAESQKTSLVASPPPRAAPVFGGAAAPVDGHATQLVALPPEGGAPRPPPPRIGAQGGIARETPAPPPAKREPPPAPPSVVVADMTPEPAPAAAPVAATGPQGPVFAAAPDPGAKPKKGGGPSKAALPARTWLLLIATVGALVAVMFMGDEEEDATVEQPPQAVVGPSATGGADAGGVRDAGGGMRVVSLAVDAGPRPDAGAPLEVVTEDGATRARRAADAVIAGRPREALPLYEELAAEQPEEESYRIIIGVLRRRIQEQCRDGVDPDGHPCEVP